MPNVLIAGFVVFGLLMTVYLVTTSMDNHNKMHQEFMTKCLNIPKKQYVWQLGCIDEGMEIRVGGGNIKFGDK